MMAKGSVVSVVMTVLDGERFIEEAIESVLSQTYPNWELLVVDDGSTDRSAIIAREFALRFPERVRCFEHPGRSNRGTSASRNLGIAHAHGDYIAFLDADDVYLPDRIERHVALLDVEREVDMVQSDTLRWYSWSDSASYDVKVPWPFEADMTVRAPGMLSRSLDRLPRDGYFPSVCSATIRRAAVNDVGGFDENFAICEDWVFFSKLYLRKNVHVMAEILAKYRKHPDSSLHRVQSQNTTLLGRYFHVHVAYLRWLEAYLEQQGAGPTLVEPVQRQLWPDGSRVLCDMFGIPPAIRLALRMTSAKRALHLALPELTYKRLRCSWGALRAMKGRLRRDSANHRAVSGRLLVHEGHRPTPGSADHEPERRWMADFESTSSGGGANGES